MLKIVFGNQHLFAIYLDVRSGSKVGFKVKGQGKGQRSNVWRAAVDNRGMVHVLGNIIIVSGSQPLVLRPSTGAGLSTKSVLLAMVSVLADNMLGHKNMMSV